MPICAYQMFSNTIDGAKNHITNTTMKRTITSYLFVLILLASCVSKKEYALLQQTETDLRNDLTAQQQSLTSCQDEKNDALSKIGILESSNRDLRDQVKTLNNTNAALLNNVGDLATLSTEGARNLEKSLESMREKDLQIKYMRDAITKRDSVTLALVTSIKGVLGNLDDKDIEVNVEKGVVFIAISDKLLFTSGSYKVNQGAKSVLGKVAKIMKEKDDIDFMVEGHTDNVPISTDGISDNWDLSVMRAASVVRVLQKDFEVEPQRMTAAGRSFYIPLADNETADGRSRNRRTRIVILPKLDQFYSMVEEGMKQATENPVPAGGDN